MRRRRFTIGALLLLAVAVSACGADNGASADAPICDDPASPFCPVQTVFVRDCALGGCHGNPLAAPMSLAPDDAYDAIVDQPTVASCPGGTRVVPGDAEASCLWQLVRDDIMPLSRPPLADADKTTLRDWIDAGAPR